MLLNICQWHKCKAKVQKDEFCGSKLCLEMFATWYMFG